MGEYNISVNDTAYCNPFRADRNPDCYFVNKSGKLYFRDYAEKSYDVFDIVIRKKVLRNFGQAVRKIWSDIPNILAGKLDNSNRTITVIEKTVKPKLKKRIRVKRKLFSKRELEFWNIGGLTITQEQLHHDFIYSVERYWINDDLYSLINMTFCYHYGGYNYQIYRPNKPKGKRHISVPVSHGDLNLIPKQYHYLVITKSKKDAFFLRRLGINAIHIVSESILLNSEIMMELYENYKVIFTLFDNDYAGKKASIRYRDLYKTIPLLYPKNDKGLKDTFDHLSYFDYMYMADLIKEVSDYYEIIP